MRHPKSTSQPSFVEQYIQNENNSCPTPDDVGTTTTSSMKKEEAGGAGPDLAVSLVFTLIELGITLTASYFVAKIIAKMVQRNAGGEDMDGFTTDLSGGGSRGVVNRLKKLLVNRHEATLKAMMEELEDHQLQWLKEGEEKKEQDEGSHEYDEEKCAKIQTERQYALSPFDISTSCWT